MLGSSYSTEQSTNSVELTPFEVAFDLTTGGPPSPTDTSTKDLGNDLGPTSDLGFVARGLATFFTASSDLITFSMFDEEVFEDGAAFEDVEDDVDCTALLDATADFFVDETLLLLPAF
jgi:hypothetical protein